MSIDCKQILNNFSELFKHEHGSTDVQIVDVSAADSPQKNTIVFVNEAKNLNTALQSEANAIVLPAKLLGAAKNSNTEKTLLTSPNATLAMALVISKFFSEKKWRPTDIHPSAFIDTTAKISSQVKIGAHSFIGPNTSIGANTVIYPNTTILENVVIGENCVIYPNVTIERNCQIGNRVEIKSGAVVGSDGFGFAPDHKGQFHRIEQRGRVVLEDNVSIGANTCIDRATFSETRIKEGTKLDNLIQVAHNCVLGKHSVYAGGTVIAGSSIIGNHVMVGGQSAIGGHLTICDQVQIGGRSGFSTDITKPGAYSGHPLLPVKQHLKTQILLSRLVDLFKDVSRLKKHTGLNTEEEIEK